MLKTRDNCGATGSALSYLFAGLALLSSNVTYPCDLLTFDEPWIREPPPVSRVAAGYVSIANNSERDIEISGVESSCCKHVMIHETVIENGDARMRHRDKLTIRANSELVLAPLGTHMMLMGAHHALQNGEEIELTFICGGQGRSTVSFPVVKR